MTDERRKDIAREYGLPQELSADDVATALEGAAAEIRRGESHEGWLAEVIARDEKNGDIRRLITGEGEAE